MKIKITCSICGASKETYKQTQRFCSKKCSGLSRRGVYPESLQKNPGGLMTRFKKGQLADSAHPKWLGDKVGYFGLHTWIQRHAGRPDKCNCCGKKNREKGKSLIEWANISKQYKRDVDDYVPLCTSCHQWADYHKVSPDKLIGREDDKGHVHTHLIPIIEA